MGITRDFAVSEDLAQESLLAFWKSPDRWKQTKGTLEPYLVGILRSKAIDYFRGQKRIAGSLSDPDGPYATVRAADTTEEDAQTVGDHTGPLDKYPQVGRLLYQAKNSSRPRLYTRREIGREQNPARALSIGSIY